MAIPKITDLVLYVTKAITGADWNTNWQKIITWLTGGTTDIKVNNVEANSMTNNGTLTCDELNVTNEEGTSVISGNLNVGGIISGDGRYLTNIRSTSTIAWTPFTVNKGYIDTTENSPTYSQEILMARKLDGNGAYTLVSFEGYINDNFPLTATTSDGVTFTLNHIDDLDCSNQQRDGSFVICVKDGQIKAEIKEKVWRKRMQPTDADNGGVPIPNNTLWLKTSEENIQCYEKINDNWNTKYDGVPIGEVVISGGVISSVLTYHYNWNGYNINTQRHINIYQRPVVITETYYASNINYATRQTQCDWCIKYSNGYVEQGGRVSWGTGDSYSGNLPLRVTLDKVCTVNLQDTRLVYNDATASGVVRSISGGNVNVSAGTTASHEGCIMWEVKGFIASSDI